MKSKRVLPPIPHDIAYLPELLVDLWALGSSPDLLVRLLEPLNLPPSTTVLDLGCGKGATLITLSYCFGFHGTGIDASAPFLKIARQKAKGYHVSDLCEFHLKDILQFVKDPKDFDIVIFASMGGFFGTFDKTVKSLRRMVRTGGYIVIDDGFLKTSAQIKKQGYQHYELHDETIEKLTTHGDTLVKEIIAEKDTAKINDQYLRAIKKRANEVIKKYPGIKDALLAHIRSQEIECEIIEKYITGAIWLFQKAQS